MLKNGFLTFCCAFIPGAGQMYQGYMKRGLSLILTACCIWLVKGPHPAKKPDASKDAPEDADFCEYHADEAAQPENAPLLSGPVVNENEVTDDDFDHEHDE